MTKIIKLPKPALPTVKGDKKDIQIKKVFDDLKSLDHQLEKLIYIT